MVKADKDARKERHQKLFEGQYQSRLGAFMFHVRRTSKRFWLAIKPSKKKLSRFMHPLDDMPAPKRLYTQVSIWSVILLMLTSVNVTYADHVPDESSTYYNDYLALEITDAFISDDEGYIIKSMPLDGEVIYDQNREENIEHEVLAGETLSVIAYRYGISSNSIKYANASIKNSNYLSVGQVLVIPPKDGLYIEVDSGDSLVSLVEDHKGDLEATMEFNGFTEESELIADSEIFIIDGEPEQVYVPVTTYTTTSTANTYQAAPTYTSAPASAEGWIRPTSGYLTCGWGCYGGHYAFDIANSVGTPIYAAASGTIIKSSYGWNGGYGNHIIIDHGNGYQTLYAHASELYVVVGQWVDQGQHIAAMGSTGRSSGPHLHLELIYYGQKIHPNNMGVF